VLVALAACSGDDASSGPTSAPSTEDGGPPPTTTPPICDDLERRYLDAFFALGAGTPNDPEATTVRLPVEALDALGARAGREGCPRFVDVACSAFAELDAQGLRAVNLDPPENC
jgi:hypothetical protein